MTSRVLIISINTPSQQTSLEAGFLQRFQVNLAVVVLAESADQPKILLFRSESQLQLPFHLASSAPEADEDLLCRGRECSAVVQLEFNVEDGREVVVVVG